MDGVCMGEHEVAKQIDKIVLLLDVTLGNGPVALDGGIDVLEPDLLVTGSGI